MITLTPDQKRRIAGRRKAGASWDTIAREMGLGVTGLRSAYDPAFKERRNALSRRRRSGDGCSAGEGKGQHERRPPEDRVRAGRAWMNVPDTRDGTAVHFGDPEPGRSAWDAADDGKRKRLAGPAASDRSPSRPDGLRPDLHAGPRKGSGGCSPCAAGRGVSLLSPARAGTRIPAKASEAPALPAGVPITAHKAGMCWWAVEDGDESTPRLFCTKPAAEGRFCTCHAALAYEREDDRRAA